MAKHPKFPQFEHISSVDVDAGLIWVGDPCYVLRDEDEPRPKDLGENWHDICDRYFQRSGYHESSREYNRWYDWGWKEALFDNPEYMEHLNKKVSRGDAPIGTNFEELPQEYQAWIEEGADIMHRFSEKWREEHPFIPTKRDVGFANFTHDGGHGGMGTAISTYYGDGTYPVYIEYGESGRPRRILIDMDPGSEEDE